MKNYGPFLIAHKQPPMISSQYVAKGSQARSRRSRPNNLYTYPVFDFIPLLILITFGKKRFATIKCFIFFSLILFPLSVALLFSQPFVHSTNQLISSLLLSFFMLLNLTLFYITLLLFCTSNLLLISFFILPFIELYNFLKILKSDGTIFHLNIISKPPKVYIH